MFALRFMIVVAFCMWAAVEGNQCFSATVDVKVCKEKALKLFKTTLAGGSQYIFYNSTKVTAVCSGCQLDLVTVDGGKVNTDVKKVLATLDSLSTMCPGTNQGGWFILPQSSSGGDPSLHSPNVKLTISSGTASSCHLI
ncbi:hypothetical protein CROQUDRAFT_202644 [Cronartium quercuum f. sp. fusiforme G11]|uniref:Uncharacterized protein n=1 Tax=Cronartium quercuum f. sp. fusiforme G11 TaxID=708437 RepID=A0A9P6NCH8_9BASI|nr:hypothetical protein CROQUDRAFT_202644 [Cronartium quercuum f. sp. fusiforme G11]